MTREEFMDLLDQRQKRYKIEDDKIIVIEEGPIGLGMPSGKIPYGVIFKNRGFVDLGITKKIDPSVIFNNTGVVIFDFKGLRYIHNWPGNIEGIYEQRLLNLMISKGLFV